MGLLSLEYFLDIRIIVVLLIIGLYLYLTRNYNYWKKQGVKEETPSFFFGNIMSCLLGKKTPVALINELYRQGECEDLIGFYAFDKPHLILRDPELIKTVFIKDFDRFSNKIMTGNRFDPFGSRSLFLVENPPWKHIRHKLSPIFTSGKLKNMLVLMLEIIEDFNKHLEKIEIDDKIGKPVDVKELTAKLMTDMIGTTAFGLKLNSLINHDAEFRSRGREIFRESYKRFISMMAILFLPQLRYLVSAKFFDDEGTNFLKKSFWEVINERVKNGIKRPDLIDLLIEIKKKQDDSNSDEYNLENDSLVAQAAIFFTGGFETTSSTTTFALYELANQIDLQSRLRNEILEGIRNNDGKVTYEMIMTLPYLDMVVHEILRLHPILGWLDRIPDCDYKFPGKNVILKKGTPVILPMAALHRDPKYFPDPDKFDPERFSESNRRNIVPFSYFPFGEGPRNCIGSRLGHIQVKLALVSYLSKYEITFCKETPRPLQYENLSVFTILKGEVFLSLRKIS